jgi:hypothetical protein
MKSKHFTLFMTWGLLGLALALLWFASGGAPASAAPTGVLTVCPAGPPNCNYSVIQDAVDAASGGDLIKVATGVYSGAQGRPVPPDYPNPPPGGVITQVVYISKTITLRGGYTAPNFADPPDPDANPTTLDAQRQGRVLLITGHISPTIEGLRITDGDATGLGGISDNGNDSGGGVYASSSVITLTNNSLLSNTAGYGGGLYQHGGKLTFEENTVSFNVADEDGGGLRIGDVSTATIRGNWMFDNQARAGGGLFLASTTAEVKHNNIVSNTARIGGGLFLTLAHATVVGNTIVSNTAHAGAGGGVYWLYGSAMFAENTVVANLASGFGGGVAKILGGTFVGNLIASNSAGYDGGGLYLSGSVALRENRIIGNQGSVGGGVIVIGASFSHDVTLTNDIIANNQASFTGCGISIASSQAHLLHTTVANNSGGDGSGISVEDYSGDPSTVAMTNTILAGHTVGISVTAGSAAMLEAALWGSGQWANGTDWAGAGTILTGTVNIWGDPAFVDPSAGDYHIGPGSAAIDAGVDAGVTTDIDHQPRPYQIPDLGADEYWPPGVLKHIYLPLILRSSQ